jgi:hypothetical protein
MQKWVEDLAKRCAVPASDLGSIACKNPRRSEVRIMSATSACIQPTSYFSIALLVRLQPTTCGTLHERHAP